MTYYQTYYPDNRVFYHTSLSERSKACIPVDGPKEDVAAFMEWVLVNQQPNSLSRDQPTTARELHDGD